MVINLVFNFILIPLWGAIGAAWATLFAESFVALYQIFVCRKEIPVVGYTLSNAFFLVAGLIMFVPVYLYGSTHLANIPTLLIQIVMGVIIYLIVGGGFMYVKEKELINSFIGNRKKGCKI